MNVGLPTRRAPIGEPIDLTGNPTLDCSDSIPDGTRFKAAIATSCGSFASRGAVRIWPHARRHCSRQAEISLLLSMFR